MRHPSVQPEIRPARLFTASCLALIATSVCFGVVGASMGGMKREFLLSNESVGWIGGAALWGFTLSIFALGPLVDTMGMKRQLILAFLCHFAGALVMIFANGFGMLFTGALILALGNGAVEASCNPLVATLYPDQKTKKLNQFHVWFPGGIVIGAVLSWTFDQIGWTDWRLKIALVIVPTVLYGILILRENFPETEGKAFGIDFRGILQGTFGRPLFWVLLFCMALTASLELGPNRWIPAVLEAGGIPGILVLAYISGLMALMRYFAGPVVERLSPPGILACSGLLTAVGLYWFSFSETLTAAFLSATVFALGVCYFWPTMLGITSEKVPRSGAFGLAMMGGTGMLAVGLFTSPMIGKVADGYLIQALPQEETQKLLSRVASEFPTLAESLPDVRRQEVLAAASLARDASAPGTDSFSSATVAALRSSVENSPVGGEAVSAEIAEILGRADNFGGRMAFRYLAPFALIIFLVFALIYWQDRHRGGYRVERLG